MSAIKVLKKELQYRENSADADYDIDNPELIKALKEALLALEQKTNAKQELGLKVKTLDSLWRIADVEKAWNTSSAIHSILIVEEKRLKELEK